MAAPLPTKFLPDVPASDDRFDAHSGVAKALRETLVSPGSGLVELVGPFGSGKSTVVELIRPVELGAAPQQGTVDDASESEIGAAEGGHAEKPARLDPATHRVVVFDGWAHQADTLRRSLLAAVLREVDPYGHLAGAQRAVGPPQLRADTVTWTTPGPWGLFAAALAFLLPIFVVFVTPAAQNIEVVTIEEGRYLARSVDTYVDPAVRLAVAFVFVGFVLAFTASRPRTHLFSAAPDDGPTARLITQHVESTHTETAPPGELDADTFETHLRAAARAWTRPRAPGGSLRALVLVIDDLDRFPDRDHDKAWAVLRSLHRLTSGPDRVEGLWVVVPNVPAPPAQAVRDGEGEYTIDNEDRRNALAWADKLFIAQFTVPPTLPSPTADHLESLLMQAFPRHPDEIAAVARARLWYGSKPSPRDAVRFVNDLVALYRQHGDAPVPLRVQAAYLTRQRAGAPLIPEDPTRLAAELDIPDWPLLVATLHHGLPPDRAAETYLADRLGLAVRDGDRPTVESALRISKRATIRLLHRTIASVRASQVALIHDNAAWTLDALPQEDFNTRLAWRHLDAEAARVKEWVDLSADGAGGRGLGAVLARAATRNPDRLDSLFRAINRTLDSPLRRGGDPGEGIGPDGLPLPGWSPIPTAADILSWVAVAVPALGEALRRHPEAGRLDDFRVPGGPDLYVKAIQTASESVDDTSAPDPSEDGEGSVPDRNSVPSALRVLRPQAPLHEIVRHLASRCESYTGIEGVGQTVGGLVAVGVDWPWRLLVDVLRERIDTATGPKAVLGTLLSTGDAEGAVTALLHIAYRSRSGARHAAAALRDLDESGALRTVFLMPHATGAEPAAIARVKNAAALAVWLHGEERRARTAEGASSTAEVESQEEVEDARRELVRWMVNRWPAIEQLAQSVGASDALAARGLP